MDHLLLTGATGFLGGAIVARLIETAEWPSVLMLVRAATPAEGRARIVSLLRSFEVPDAQLARIGTRQIICGDISAADEFAADARLERVTHVINCAALASFANHPQIWPVNVTGTLEFARVLRNRSPLQRFLHVGTAMACGVQAPSPVSEDYEPGTDAEHIVDYTASKFACEQKLREELPDLPLVVARPSIIVGHTRLGCKPSPSIFWVFSLAATLRRFTCDLDQKIDVVPVDYCADALLALLRKPVLSHDRYHLSAGPASSTTYGEICDALAPIIGARANEPYQKVAYPALARMQDCFDALFGKGNKRLLLRAIRLYGEFAALGITFDNRRTRAEGIPAPVRFADYAALCAESTRGISIYEQMKYDFKGAGTKQDAERPKGSLPALPVAFATLCMAAGVWNKIGPGADFDWLWAM